METRLFFRTRTREREYEWLTITPDAVGRPTVSVAPPPSSYRGRGGPLEALTTLGGGACGFCRRWTSNSSGEKAIRYDAICTVIDAARRDHMGRAIDAVVAIEHREPAPALARFAALTRVCLEEGWRAGHGRLGALSAALQVAYAAVEESVDDGRAARSRTRASEAADAVLASLSVLSANAEAPPSGRDERDGLRLPVQSEQLIFAPVLAEHAEARVADLMAFLRASDAARRLPVLSADASLDLAVLARNDALGQAERDDAIVGLTRVAATPQPGELGHSTRLMERLGGAVRRALPQAWIGRSSPWARSAAQLEADARASEARRRLLSGAQSDPAAVVAAIVEVVGSEARERRGRLRGVNMLAELASAHTPHAEAALARLSNDPTLREEIRAHAAAAVTAAARAKQPSGAARADRCRAGPAN